MTWFGMNAERRRAMARVLARQALTEAGARAQAVENYCSILGRVGLWCSRRMTKSGGLAVDLTIHREQKRVCPESEMHP